MADKDKTRGYDFDNIDPQTAAVVGSVRVPTEHETVEHNMTNHAPLHSGVVETFEGLRRTAKLFAHQIVDVCPPSEERRHALANAEQALMWAVASVARNQS